MQCVLTFRMQCGHSVSHSKPVPLVLLHLQPFRTMSFLAPLQLPSHDCSGWLCWGELWCKGARRPSVILWQSGGHFMQWTWSRQESKGQLVLLKARASWADGAEMCPFSSLPRAPQEWGIPVCTLRTLFSWMRCQEDSPISMPLFGMCWRMESADQQKKERLPRALLPHCGRYGKWDHFWQLRKVWTAFLLSWW